MSTTDHADGLWPSTTTPEQHLETTMDSVRHPFTNAQRAGRASAADPFERRSAALHREIEALIANHAIDEGTWGALDRLIDHWRDAAEAELRSAHERTTADLQRKERAAQLRLDAAEARVDAARARVEELHRRREEAAALLRRGLVGRDRVGGPGPGAPSGTDTRMHKDRGPLGDVA